MDGSIPTQSWRYNAMLESWVQHLRNLLEFFYGRGGDQEIVRVADFFGRRPVPEVEPEVLRGYMTGLTWKSPTCRTGGTFRGTGMSTAFRPRSTRTSACSLRRRLSVTCAPASGAKSRRHKDTCHMDRRSRCILRPPRRHPGRRSTAGRRATFGSTTRSSRFSRRLPWLVTYLMIGRTRSSQRRRRARSGLLGCLDAQSIDHSSQ